MKTTKRFDNAVMKLYNAFHENRLNAYDCTACAVGNMLNNSGLWGKFSIIANRRFSKRELEIAGYATNELNTVESLFMKGTKIWYGGGEKFRHNTSTNREAQFKGLCAVVEYLAELDNIPNPMDYTKLFETENDKPKYELILN